MVISTSVLALLAASVAGADEPEIVSAEDLAARYPGVEASDIRDAPIAGLYEVVSGGRISYLTKDGRFLFQGEIIDLGNDNQNLTEARRAESRAELFASVDPATEIVFSPADGVVRHRVIAFTDVDCGYCRQLHREIALVNALGIEVRYLAYPRTGPDTESWAKAEAVWCAEDRMSALTEAKLGGEVPAVSDCTPPVATHYEIGQRIGIPGTPGLYSESGVDLGGYLPPDRLLAVLERLAAQSSP
jgi:thiol:disulfide interchange protein DsbC